MKTRFRPLLAFTLSSGLLHAQLKLEIQIPTRQPALLCEPMNMKASWKNTGATPLRLGKTLTPTQSKFVSLWINGVYKETMPLSSQTQVSGGGSAISPFNNHNVTAEELAAGEERNGPTYLQSFLSSPGTYQIQLIADFGGQTEGSFHGKAESNVLNVKVASPDNKEKEYFDRAVKAANEHKSEYRRAKPDDSIQPWEYCGRLASMETIEGRQLVALHPDSIYSAWAVYDKLILGDSWTPSKVKDVIEAGQYPGDSCSIPDPSSPARLKNIYGKSCMQWRNNMIKTILAMHPDFPYAEKLKLNYGIYLLSLGNEDEGSSYLHEIASRPTDEGRWATEFLSHWILK